MTYVGEGGIPDLRQRVYREKGFVTLDGSGEATITFTNPTSGTFHIQLTPWIGAGDNPVIANPVSWVMTGGDVTGVNISGARLMPLPTPLTLISQLVGFEPWSNSGISGTRVDWMLF